MSRSSRTPASKRESRGASFGWGPKPIAVFITFLFTVSMPSVVEAQSLRDLVTYDARDSMRYDVRNQIVYLFGSAKVTYEGLELTAERIVLDMKNEETRAYGAPDTTGTIVGLPEFRQGGKTVTADSIRYNFRTKKGLIREVRSTENQLYAVAHLSKLEPNEEVHSRGGMLTTCDRPHPHYHFAVSRMIVIPDDKIVTGPAIMKVGKVPTPLVIPFGLFPNQNNGAAGILIPTWGKSDELGYYLLNGGYYLPINDHVDAQLTGDIYSRGSWGLRAQSRYKSRYHYSGSVDITRSTLLNSIPEYPDYSKHTTFFLRWNHLLDPKASLTDRFTATVNVGSSENFTNNFNSTTGDYLSNTFASSIQWNHLWSGKPYSLSVGLTHNQNTIDRTFNFNAPTTTFNVQRVFPADWFRGGDVVGGRRWYDNVGLTWTSTFDNQLKTTEDQIYLGNVSNLVSQMRNGLRHTGSVGTSFKTRFFSLNPEVRFTDRMYFDQLQKTYDVQTGAVEADTVAQFAAPFEWSAGASLTSKLYGMYTFSGKKLRAIRHVITPSTGLSYSPGNDTRITGPFGDEGAQSSYSPYDIGIYGPPSPNASGLVSLGLVQSVEAKVLAHKPEEETGADGEATEEYKKVKLLDFLGVNTSYDLLKDSLNWNPVNVSARTQLFNRIDVSVVSIWDPYSTDTSGTRISRTQYELDGRLARRLNTTVAVGFEVKSKRYGQSTTGGTTNNNTETVVGEADPDKGARVNFSLPWHLRVNYSYDVNRAWKESEFTDSQSQSVLFNGDLNILKWWKLGFSSGYDLEAQEWTPTSLNLYWDMHCWEFNLNVIPIGTRKSFTMRINVKASVIHDLKYELMRPFGNDGQLLR